MDRNIKVKITATDGDKLMELLLSNVKGKSRNNIKSMLSRGDVAVNGVVQKQFDFALSDGDLVTVGEDRVKNTIADPRLNIIFEDDDIIVINKPEGLLTIASDKEKNETAYRLVTDYVRAKTGGRVFIVHRLDRDTSGIVLFAKTEEMKNALQDDWDDLVSHRGYTAVVEGCVEKQKDRICSYLRETKTHVVYSDKFGQDGLRAVTYYSVLKQNMNYSLLEIKLETGRKNQIRVHMSEMEHPVVGDKKYGAETNPLKRLCLHAGKLELTHPVTKQALEFYVPTPKKFENLVK